MAYLTPGERLVDYLRRTTFVGLRQQALRDGLRLAMSQGQREEHMLVAFEDIAVLNVARRLIVGAGWALQRLGDGAVADRYLSDLVVNELIIDYSNVRKVKDYLLPCAEAARSQISKSMRREVLSESGFVCYMCGRSLAIGAVADPEQGNAPPATVDHVWPRGYGGDSSFANLLPACPECNTAKASMAGAKP